MLDLLFLTPAFAVVQMQSRAVERWHRNTNKRPLMICWHDGVGRTTQVSSCGLLELCKRAVWVMFSSRGDSGRGQISAGLLEGELKHETPNSPMFPANTFHICI